MSALVLRIKFPSEYPLIYKTLRVNANYNVKEAIAYISQTVNTTSLLKGNEGLYIPDRDKWLEDDVPLSSFDFLQDVEHIEFKSKTSDGGSQKSSSGGSSGGSRAGGGGCCAIL